MPEDKKPIRVMIREAVEALGGSARNNEIRRWVKQQYPSTNDNSVSTQIVVHTVNAPARVNFPENARPRRADNADKDFLFKIGRGEVELHDPARHGVWEIVETEDGKMGVGQVDGDAAEALDVAAPGVSTATLAGPSKTFAAEDHLRDYLVRNLAVIEPGLVLYVDDDGRTGVEYTTPIGRIDILAIDTEGRLVVIELKVGQGVDAVVGQVLRYRGWVRQHLAEGKPVRSVLVAENYSEKLMYAVGEVEGVELCEYALSITVTKLARK